MYSNVTSLNILFHMSDTRMGPKIYPKGLPVSIDVDKYTILNALIEEPPKKYTAKPAYCSKGKAFDATI